MSQIIEDPNPQVTVSLYAVRNLAEFALDKLHAADQDEGCCTQCCAACDGLSLLLEDGRLDELAEPRWTEASEWWVDGKVDREWLKRAWRMQSCHAGDGGEY